MFAARIRPEGLTTSSPVWLPPLLTTIGTPTSFLGLRSSGTVYGQFNESHEPPPNFTLALTAMIDPHLVTFHPFALYKTLGVRENYRSIVASHFRCASLSTLVSGRR